MAGYEIAMTDRRSARCNQLFLTLHELLGFHGSMLESNGLDMDRFYGVARGGRTRFKKRKSGH